MPDQAAFLGETYGQLASLSAILGGLAFASAAALLAVAASTRDDRPLDRAASFTVGAAVVSATGLILTSLLWTLASVYFQGTGGRATGTSADLPAEQVAWLTAVSTQTFLVGLTAFFVSLATSGWISSRRLGIVTTAVSVLAGAVALAAVFTFTS